MVAYTCVFFLTASADLNIFIENNFLPFFLIKMLFHCLKLWLIEYSEVEYIFHIALIHLYFLFLPGFNLVF